MTNEGLLELAELIDMASLVTLVVQDRKAGLGRDMQDEIVKALRFAAEMERNNAG